MLVGLSLDRVRETVVIGVLGENVPGPLYQNSVFVP